MWVFEESSGLSHQYEPIKPGSKPEQLPALIPPDKSLSWGYVLRKPVALSTGQRFIEWVAL